MRRVAFGRTAIAVQALLAAAFVVFLISHQQLSLPFSDDGRWTVRVAFADAGGLHAGSRAPVTVAGVTAGRVTAVSYHDGAAVATLELDRAARGVLHTDTQATITPRSALEDLTVDLTPGSPRAPALAPNALVPTTNSHGPVALDRVVDTLDTDTRAQVEVLLDQLAVGLRARPGALRDAVARLQGTLDPAAQVTGVLARRRVLLTRLSGELATTFSALGGHDAALAG
ncbi:MAG: phospholipid/cholesterol/gamma-HCH transport system substrate-binding protein, partial [Solirubrobacteraceae bacterium]|nr:phospholipid/cholesterol/gamma-HCH transport system substrate-binding protein [Solirubrobacteraceae bacterium]